MNMKTLDKSYTYTKWHSYYKKKDDDDDDDTFIIYKTRHKRPTWWPKNINSEGYEETIKLATVYTSIQSRFVVSFFVIGLYVSKVEICKDIGFADRLRIWGQISSINAYELYRIKPTIYI